MQKRIFDEGHVPRSFEIGAMVLAKRMGRLDKLSNRYDGPLRVVERDRDIYKVKCDETGKSLSRHISDLKMFKVASAILVASVLINTSQQVVFERSSPVVWQETNKFVSPGQITVTIRLACHDSLPKHICELVVSLIWRQCQISDVNTI